MPLNFPFAAAAVAVTLLTQEAAFAGIKCGVVNTPYLSEGIGDAGLTCHEYFPETGRHTLTADGSDIWGTYDGLTFGGLKQSGDIVVAARVTNLTNTNGWAKGGVMLRAGLGGGSRNAYMAISPSNGVTFQTRLGDGQNTTNSVVGGMAVPYWVKLEKRGNTIKGFRSPDGVTWTQVGATATLNLGNDFYAGVAATSHEPGVSGHSEYQNLTLAPLGSGGFINKALGTPANYGSLSESGGTYTLRASGNDIWGSADQGQFAYQQISGDRAIIARVASVQNTDSWAKAGVMIRENLEDFSPNAYVFVTAASGVHFQRRTLSGAATVGNGTSGILPAHWVKLEKRGNLVKSFRSSDGAAWTQVGSVALNLGRTYYLGLAATSHNSGLVGNHTFTNVQVQALESDGFESQNIGSPSLAGSYSKSGGTHSLAASGADVYGSSDQFRYAYQKRKGDHTIIARVASVQNTNAWAKAGVMIRTGLAANSRNAFLAVTPSNGVTFQQRGLEGGATSYQQNTGFAAPHWVKLEKRGSVVRAYRGSDGINWTQVGSTANLNLGNEFYIGLAHTSHTNTALSTATFTDVVVAPAPSLSVLPISELGWAQSLEQFAMDQTEVTEEEYLSTMVAVWGAQARGGRKGTLKPITNITWADAILYANARSVRDGFRPIYTFTRGNHFPPDQSPCVSGFPGNGCMIDNNTHVDRESYAHGYALPTDAEWDLAASVVMNGPFQPNPSRYVWGLSEAGETSSATIGKHAVWNTTASANVGSKLASQEGLTLFDMAGNAGEWTFEKNVRGGSWGSTTSGQVQWTAKVNRSALNYRDNQTGLRLILPIARRDGHLLTKQEKERFLNAVFTLKNTKFPGYERDIPVGDRFSWWDWFAMSHDLGMMLHYYDAVNNDWPMVPRDVAHGGPAFLTWHREFVNQMELALQTVDPRVALPYVRWGYGDTQFGSGDAQASMDGILAPYNSATGAGLLGFVNAASQDLGGIFNPALTLQPANLPLWWPLGENGPLAGWNVPSYVDLDFGGDGRLVRQEAPTFAPVSMDGYLQHSTYQNFLWDVEQFPHNRFHNALSGHMGTMRSPIDPIFYLHHVEVDRAWRMWQETHGVTPYVEPVGDIGQDLTDPLWPFSGSFYKPMDSEISHLPQGYFPSWRKSVTMSELLYRKMPKYMLF